MVIDAVISQSDVIRFMNHHQGDLGAVMQRNLHDIGLGGDWDDEPTSGATDAGVSSAPPPPAAATVGPSLPRSLSVSAATAAAAAAAAAAPGTDRNVGGGSVACVLFTTRTLEAFSLMYAEGVSAVGVVREPRGSLIDCLCVSDLRGISQDTLPTLDLTVSPNP